MGVECKGELGQGETEESPTPEGVRLAPLDEKGGWSFL